MEPTNPIIFFPKQMKWGKKSTIFNNIKLNYKEEIECFIYLIGENS